MFEQLGLGVTMTMEDNFTPQANNMLSSFTRLEDGAEHMQKQVSQSMMTLQNLMLSGFSLREIGQEFENMGGKIVKTFGNIFKGITDTGKQFETFKKTLGTFFKGDTENAINWGVNLASKTPFQITDTLDAMKSLKAVGMDVRKQYDYITSDGKKAQKSFLEFVGDIGAFNPAQGMQGAMFAIRELMGGQTRSLKNRFDINPELILGRKIDTSSIDKLQQDIVTLSQKIAPNLMKNLEGTFDQTVSNMADIWTMFKWKIADTGVFDSVKKTLNNVFTALTTIDMDRTVKPIGEAIKALWKPIDFVVTGLTNMIVKLDQLTESHPILAKLALGFLGVSGALLATTGFIMNFAGGIIITATSILSLVMNMKMLAMVQGGMLAPVTESLKWHFLDFGRVLGTVGLIGIGAFTAWKFNLFGFRDAVESASARIKSAWGESTAILAGGNNVLFQWKKQGEDIDGFSVKLAKVRAVFSALGTILFTPLQGGKQIFSDDQYKMFTNTGILGFVQDMVMIKGRVVSFFDGFAKGLSTVLKIGKEFLDIVLIPIKAVWNVVSPLFDKMFGAQGVGAGGQNMSVAQQEVQKWADLGKVAGDVVGVLLGFKIIGTITDIISAPFKSLFNWMSKVHDTADKVKSKLSGFGIGSQETREIIKGRVSKASDYIKDNDKHVTLRDGLQRGSMHRVDPQDVYGTYYEENLAKRGLGGSLYVKRKPEFLRTLLGDTYYNRNADGSYNKVGKFGGIFNLDRDDAQIRMMAQAKYQNGGVMPSVNTVDGIKHRVTGMDTEVGRIFAGHGLTESANMRSSLMKEKTTRLYGKNGLLNSTNFPMPTEQEYMDNINERFFTDKHMGMMSKQQWDAVVSRNTARGRAPHEVPLLRHMYDNFIHQSEYNYATTSGKGSGNIKAIDKILGSEQSLYRDDKQSALSRALFGQKYYTQSMDDQGRYHRTTVMRNGGLLRNAENDMKYNAESSLWSRFKGSKPISGLTGLLSSGWTATKGAFGTALHDTGNLLFNNAPMRTLRNDAKLSTMMAREAFMGSAPVRAVRGFGSWAGGRLSKAGIHLPSFGGVGGALKTGVGAIGRGAMSGIGMLGKGVGAVGRGIGAVGSFALGALPMAMMVGSLGKMAYGAISAKGGGDFHKGLQELEKSASKLNLNGMWANLKTSFNKNMPVIKQIAKDLWGQIKLFMPPVMKEAWQGLMGLGKIAWAWIKNDGLKSFTNIALGLGTILGKALSFLEANAGKMVGNILKFVLGTALPAIVKGVTDLGAYILTHLPEAFTGVFKLAVTLFKGIGGVILDVMKGAGEGILGAFQGIAQGLGKLIVAGLTGVIRMLLPEPLEEPVLKALGLPLHHGGLFMSSNEHTAIIRKDETVLPPEISKGFKDIIETNTPVRRSGGSGGSGGDIKIDTVKIEVQADKLSRADARKQAKLILEELKKLKKEKMLRTYQDITEGSYDII